MTTNGGGWTVRACFFCFVLVCLSVFVFAWFVCLFLGEGFGFGPWSPIMCHNDVFLLHKENITQSHNIIIIKTDVTSEETFFDIIKFCVKMFNFILTNDLNTI